MGHGNRGVWMPDAPRPALPSPPVPPAAAVARAPGRAGAVLAGQFAHGRTCFESSHCLARLHPLDSDPLSARAATHLHAARYSPASSDFHRIRSMSLARLGDAGKAMLASFLMAAHIGCAVYRMACDARITTIVLS